MRETLEDTARVAVQNYLDDLVKKLRDLERNGSVPDEQKRLRIKIRYVNEARFHLLNAAVL